MKTIQAITPKALTVSLIQPSTPSGDTKFFVKFTSRFTLWRSAALVAMCLVAPNALHAVASNPIVDIIQRWTQAATKANVMAAEGWTYQKNFVQSDLNNVINVIDTALTEQWSHSEREDQHIPFTDPQLNDLKDGLNAILLYFF